MCWACFQVGNFPFPAREVLCTSPQPSSPEGLWLGRGWGDGTAAATEGGGWANPALKEREVGSRNIF